MASKAASVLLIFIYPFFFADHECYIISGRDADGSSMDEQKLIFEPVDLSKPNLFEGDILVNPGHGYSATFDNQIWSTKKIPYIISYSYTKDQLDLILDAMEAYKNYTCIEFTPRTNEKDYINIIYGSGCYSNLGRIGGVQTVSIGAGCFSSRTVKHELMHAIGFYHEQSRTDRDAHVQIHFDNIAQGMAGQFQKYDAKVVQLLGTPYDTKSIMHYGWSYFAKDTSKPTITDKNGKKVRPSDDFTLIDILDLNRLYKCPDRSLNIKWKEQAWNNWKFFWGQDCDIVGKDIRKAKSSKSEECGGLCAADLECTHFTWESKGICTLKIAPKRSSVARSLKTATCGYITEGNSNLQWKDINTPAGIVKYSETCDFYGNDLQNVKRTNKSCPELCYSDPKCSHYSVRVDPSSGSVTCFLKDGKSPVARDAYDDNSYCGIISARIGIGK